MEQVRLRSTLGKKQDQPVIFKDWIGLSANSRLYFKTSGLSI
jgi:hypothetical protein